MTKYSEKNYCFKVPNSENVQIIIVAKMGEEGVKIDEKDDKENKHVTANEGIDGDVKTSSVHLESESYQNANDSDNKGGKIDDESAVEGQLNEVIEQSQTEEHRCVDSNGTNAVVNGDENIHG